MQLLATLTRGPDVRDKPRTELVVPSPLPLPDRLTERLLGVKAPPAGLALQRSRVGVWIEAMTIRGEPAEGLHPRLGDPNTHHGAGL